VPRTPSAFQQASSKAFLPFLLAWTSVLSFEEDNGFEDSSRALFPCLKTRPFRENGASILGRCGWEASAGDRRSPRAEIHCGWKGVKSVCLERDGWKVTTYTSAQGRLHWSPSGATCRSARLPLLDEVG
jgi:hypothetical protein